MRYFVNFVLLLALCACGWFLYDQSRQPTVDLVAETKLKVDVPELVLATIEARKNDETPVFPVPLLKRIVLFGDLSMGVS